MIIKRGIKYLGILIEHTGTAPAPASRCISTIPGGHRLTAPPWKNGLLLNTIGGLQVNIKETLSSFLLFSPDSFQSSGNNKSQE